MLKSFYGSKAFMGQKLLWVKSFYAFGVNYQLGDAVYYEIYGPENRAHQRILAGVVQCKEHDQVADKGRQKVKEA
jgi:hypothetical protein